MFIKLFLKYVWSIKVETFLLENVRNEKCKCGGPKKEVGSHSDMQKSERKVFDANSQSLWRYCQSLSLRCLDHSTSLLSLFLLCFLWSFSLPSYQQSFFSSLFFITIYFVFLQIEHIITIWLHVLVHLEEVRLASLFKPS